MKLSIVFSSTLVWFTKNKNFLYPLVYKYNIKPAIMTVFPLPVAIWKEYEFALFFLLICHFQNIKQNY